MNSHNKILSKDTKISKTLSWILRHGAIQQKLPISNDGFLDIDIVLSHYSLRRLNCKLHDIERIIENDPKKRYTLIKCENNDKLKIKANQGHSMSQIDNLNLRKIEKPTQLSNVIHGTYFCCLNSIKKEGLKRMKRNHIHFTQNENFNENISGFRDKCEILIYIDFVKAMNDGIEFLITENNVILSTGINGCIKPEYFLKIVERKTISNKNINN